MSDTLDIVHTYFAAWNDLDRGHRSTTIETLFTEDATVVDPDWTAEGRDAIAAAIGQAREEKLGNLVLTVIKVISAHHDHALFSWHLLQPDTTSTPLATGYGVVSVENGRIKRAYDFFG
ncbi:nuclear transport factor 2 family protein [Spirillospora sp. CA-142024]|uniref:nuclear transport factor 2 family protein n=1 Tax=Spirillospora sp. CA-142024 TaxID=3240036 RepID=UPI003D8CB190